MLNIKNARVKAGLRQIDIAKVMNVAQPTVSSWEANASAPSAEQLPELAKLFDCTIDDLFDQCEEESHARGCVKPGA